MYLISANALDQTISAVLDRVNLNETLVIATGDHSHAFAITGYPPLNNPILGYMNDPDRQDSNLTQASLTYGAGYKTEQSPPANTNEYHVNYTYPAALLAKKGRHGGEDVVIMANGPMAHLFQVICCILKHVSPLPSPHPVARNVRANNQKPYRNPWRIE